MKELIFNRHRVFVSVTRIDVLENYLQQERHNGGGWVGGKSRDKGGGRGKGGMNREKVGGNSGIREGEGERGAFPLIE